jgi:hypothetical protein
MTIALDLSDLAPTGERPAADTSSALMSRGCGPRAQTALAVHVGSFGDSHPVVGGLMKKEPLLFKALGGHAGDNRHWGVTSIEDRARYDRSTDRHTHTVRRIICRD